MDYFRSIRFYIYGFALATLAVISARFFAILSLGSDERVFSDFVLLAIYLFSVLSAAFFGFNHASKITVWHILALTILPGLSLALSWFYFREFNWTILSGGLAIIIESAVFFLVGRYFQAKTTRKVPLAKLVFFSIVIILIFISSTIKNLINNRTAPHRAAADIVWILTVQYYGNLGHAPHPKLPRYLESVQTLDPKFCQPYSFGLVTLTGPNTENAIEIGKRGIKNCPEDWRIYYYLAFAYHKENDKEKAAEFFELAASKPSAPQQVKDAAANYRKSLIE